LVIRTLIRPELLFLVFGDTQIPLEVQVFSFCVAVHPLAITSELGIVRWKKLKTRHCSTAKFIHHRLFTKKSLDIPMRGDRTEVDESHAGLGGRELFINFGVGHRCSFDSDRITVPAPASGTISSNKRRGNVPTFFSE
jgi:hypothetical protein